MQCYLQKWIMVRGGDNRDSDSKTIIAVPLRRGGAGRAGCWKKNLPGPISFEYI